MAAIVEFLGNRITEATSTANWSSFRFNGNNGASNPEFPADDSIQGGNALGFTFTQANRGFIACYDYVGAGGTALNFSAGGANENQMLSVWAQNVFPLASTGSVNGGYYGGIGLAVGSDATLGNSYAAWSIYGSENYPGGWVKLIIDPRKTPTISGGTFTASSLSSIRWLGISYFLTAGKTGPQGIFIDAIDIGSGLRIYGSGTEQDGFADLLLADEGTTANKYGIIKSLDASSNILQLQSKLFIGDSTGTNQTIFNDIDKTIVIGQPQYIDSNGVFQNALPDDYLEINVEGNSTSRTDVTFGIVVSGTDINGNENLGRNGLTFLGNDLYNINFNFNDGNVDSVKLYGTILRNFKPTGGLVWDAETNHELVGSFMDNCAMVRPDSGVFIRNTTFLNHTSAGTNEGSLYFTSNAPSDTVIDIKNSSFVANDYAIEHPATGEFSYDNLKFSANTYDVYLNYTGGAIASDPEFELTINLTNGANATTYISGANSGDIELLSAVTLTLTNIQSGSEVRIRPINNSSVVLFSEENVTDGTSEYVYNYPPVYEEIDIFVMKVPNYKWFSLTNYTLGSSSAELYISQIPDRTYDNP